MGYRNIVVGTDGSPTAEIAVRHAAGLAKAFGARLTVVTAYAHDAVKEGKHVEELPADLRWMATDVNQAEGKAQHGKRLARELGVKDVVVHVGEGDPTDALLSAVEERGGDLIVVGNKGLASASRSISGNVPYKVSHRAPCDIVIVHTTD
ncbi:MAG TPA: universal stress protein [Acidimicrobiales bacterium]|nr:universal stress protein [Acidimicrobiales bacterium]